MNRIIIRGARLRDGRKVDVRVTGSLIAEVLVAGTARKAPGESAVDAHGLLLLPGLHDHHLHLLASAAAQHSTTCGPPEVTTADELARALTVSPRVGEWVRGIGYHESVAGDLDRQKLDALVPSRPVRVQHRSGALWVVNSAGLDALGADLADAPPGVERDSDGRLTGRLFRADDWLRRRLGASPWPDLGRLGSRLADHGVTGVTDATPDLGPERLTVLLEAVATNLLPQRLCLLGVDHLPGGVHPDVLARVTVGPRKVVLADHDLPTLPDLIDHLQKVRATSANGRRPVAVHCVTRLALILLCAAFKELGTVPGDRIEHAAVVPAALLQRLSRLGVTVVTQPGLVAERGDTYLREVRADDMDGLYRYASLLAAGVPVGMSTDAPYTDLDPWSAVLAAMTRQTRGGRTIGIGERVDAWTALGGFLTSPHDAGGRQRAVESGAMADLVLIDDWAGRGLTKIEKPTVIGTMHGGHWRRANQGWDQPPGVS